MVVSSSPAFAINVSYCDCPPRRTYRIVRERPFKEGEILMNQHSILTTILETHDSHRLVSVISGTAKQRAAIDTCANSP